MTEVEILQIQNEIFTNLVIEELSKQRDGGKKKGEFLLDKYAVDLETKARLKKFISDENAAKDYVVLR